MQREIEVLKECIGIRVRINDTGEWLEVTPAIEKAIKCMELFPELTDDSTYLMVCMDEGYRMKDIKPIILDSIINRINQAKEMLSDES